MTPASYFLHQRIEVLLGTPDAGEWVGGKITAVNFSYRSSNPTYEVTMDNGRTLMLPLLDPSRHRAAQPRQ